MDMEDNSRARNASSVLGIARAAESGNWQPHNHRATPFNLFKEGEALYAVTSYNNLAIIHGKLLVSLRWWHSHYELSYHTLVKGSEGRSLQCKVGAYDRSPISYLMTSWLWDHWISQFQVFRQNLRWRFPTILYFCLFVNCLEKFWFRQNSSYL